MELQLKFEGRAVGVRSAQQELPGYLESSAAERS